MSEREVFTGEDVVLRATTLDDRDKVYRWLVESEMYNKSTLNSFETEKEIRERVEFYGDYLDYYFDDTHENIGKVYIIEAEGREIGAVSYENHHHTVELDIWIKSRDLCGKGYGPKAIQTLYEALHAKFGWTTFLLRPSRENLPAIRAFERAGFTRLDLNPLEINMRFGSGDYEDEVVMFRSMSPAQKDPEDSQTDQ